MMTNTQLAAASFNDIVFDGRNKGYGAYELRALYQRHVSRALVIGSSIFALLIVFPLLAQYAKGNAPVESRKRIVEVIPIAPPVIDEPVVTPPPPVTQASPPPPPAPVARYVTFKVEKDDKVTETPPDVETLVNKRIGTENIESEAKPGDELIEVPVAKPAEVGETAPTNKPYIYVEQMPELPGGGGVAAIVAAIQRAVKYPPVAIRNGVEGKLYASFVVNEKGEVTDVKIVKGLGSGLDEESIRAINALPRFIPGKQNGREVSVQYNVPITYKIQ